MEIDMTPENAERELLELIRLEDAQRFTLQITVDDGQWMVATGDPAIAGPAVGRGASFAEAWFSQNPQF